MHPVEELRAALRCVEPYPSGIIPVPEPITGTAFFPGGTGLWNPCGSTEPGAWPRGGVMVLGHDFDSQRGYEASRARGTETAANATWRALLPLLDSAAIPPERCFFTNAYMGLRAGGKATGPYPGSRDVEFVARCRAFLRLQVQLQAPTVILALGQATPGFLAPLAPELAAWTNCNRFAEIDGAGPVVTSATFPDTPPCAVVVLTHPSYRALNVARRRFETFVGDEAERAMLRRAVGGRPFTA